jgi:hypothetical protein
MGLIERILGPKSKYDKSLPYTYEARICILKEGEEYNSCFADTICGLVEHLHRSGVKPDDAQIFEIYQAHEIPVDARRFSSSCGEWLFKPEICRAFEDYYQGHIHPDGCSFEDRDGKGSGP